MRCYFFDSSALAKRYHPEDGTAEVAAIFCEAGSEIRISRLSFVELQSVFAMKVRAGLISETDAIHLRARLLGDIAEGLIHVSALRPVHYDAAGQLIGKHGFSLRLRTLDALQLAVALSLKDEGLADRFVVSDNALAEVAAPEGLSVLNPAR